MEDEKLHIPQIPSTYIQGIAELGYYDAKIEADHASPRVVKAMEHINNALCDLQNIIVQQNAVIEYLMKNQKFEKRKLEDGTK